MVKSWIAKWYCLKEMQSLRLKQWLRVINVKLHESFVKNLINNIIESTHVICSDVLKYKGKYVISDPGWDECLRLDFVSFFFDWPSAS